MEWLFRGKKKLATALYAALAVGFVVLGSLLSNDLVWELTDLFNQLMVLPNALALFALSGTAVAAARGKAPVCAAKEAPAAEPAADISRQGR